MVPYCPQMATIEEAGGRMFGNEVIVLVRGVV
jgi:hypothetical protein